MTRTLALLVAVLSALLSAAAVACSSCGRSGVLATLLEKHGSVERDHAASVGQWMGAEVGAQFRVGDGVRSHTSAGARLELDDRSKLVLESETVIRFLNAPSKSDGPQLSLEMGEASLETADRPVRLSTDVGIAVIEPGTQVRLKKTDAGVRYEVSVGLARIEQTSGERIEVAPGQTRTLTRASAPPAESRSVAAAPPPAPSAAASPGPRAPDTSELIARVRGYGASVKPPGAIDFSALAPGDSALAPDTTLRLPAHGTAEVERGNERALLRGAGEFVVGGKDKPFVTTSAGGVSLDETRTEVHVSVPGGTIVARLGSSADVRVKKGTAEVSVSAGKVELRGASARETLDAGEHGAVSAKGEIEIAERSLSYRDFSIALGQSCAVHDPSPPTALGFSTEHDCPEGAVVELQGRTKIRARGTGTVSVLLPAGSHRYQVRCLDHDGKPGDVRKKGSITILHDGGTARLPRTAPETVVDTDGRNYTVLYQSLLPKISVRWPKAPKPGPYTLRATTGGKTETVSTAAPFHAFASGALREGSNRLSFQAASGETSKVTTVDIRFDNAAPAASLTSPVNGQFTPGQTVTVAGTALEDWTVSVGGKTLPLDAQQRFSNAIATPAGERALAILFVNPRRGVHYYLRRAAPH